MLNSELLVKMYQKMLLIRIFEEKVSELFAKGKIPGFAHLSLGEEAIPVGTCENLEKEDHITSTHRGHGDILAKGADPKYVFAEIFGKSSGYCKGKGGSMHIADYSLGIIGANGIVGAGFPIATGSALAQQQLGTKNVTVCFFGDGSANEGSFHESVNLASIWKLPVIFVCKNNLYGATTPASYSLSVQDISSRGAAYNIPGVTVDGNDVIAVYEAVNEAVERARNGSGPSLVECKTYRWHGHFEGEEALGWTYRSKEEIEEWKKKDPIPRFENNLLNQGILSKADIEKAKKETQELIEDAVKFAEEAPLPNPEDALIGLFPD
jgi:pyruvate dehydrogenase E1 component alpha subunit